MFVDTSAIVAILSREPDAAGLSAAMARASIRLTSPLVRLEACIVLSSRLRQSPTDVEKELDAFLAEAGIAVIDITDVTGRLAVEAFQRFGKGRGSAAQLNIADCMSYACAREHEAAILFKGKDFSHTDLRSALSP